MARPFIQPCHIIFTKYIFNNLSPVNINFQRIKTNINKLTKITALLLKLVQLISMISNTVNKRTFFT